MWMRYRKPQRCLSGVLVFTGNNTQMPNPNGGLLSDLIKKTYVFLVHVQNLSRPPLFLLLSIHQAVRQDGDCNIKGVLQMTYFI